MRIDHTDDSLTVGERGPTLLEDFHAREKTTHFDHERIPERVVHARGAGAYGTFRPDAVATLGADGYAMHFITEASSTPSRSSRLAAAPRWWDGPPRRS